MKRLWLTLLLAAFLGCDKDENASIQSTVDGAWRVEAAVVRGNSAEVVPYDCRVTFDLKKQTVVFDEDFSLSVVKIEGNNYALSGNNARINFNNKTFQYSFSNNKLLLSSEQENENDVFVVTLGRIR